MPAFKSNAEPMERVRSDTPAQGVADTQSAQKGPASGRQSATSLLTTLTQAVLLISGTVFCADFARPVLVPVFMAWVGSMALKPPVDWLRKLGWPGPLAAGLVTVVFVFTLGFVTYSLGSPAVDWIKSAPENLPRLKDKFANVLAPAARLTAAASSVSNLATPDDTAKKPQPVEVKDNRVAGSVFSWTGNLLAGIGETLALLYLLLAAGDDFANKLIRMTPTARDKKKTTEIVRQIQRSISAYLFAVGLVNLGFGVAVGFSLHLLGLPNSAMWGGVAAFANFIPYFGPILGILSVAMAGVLAATTLTHGLLPAVAYLGLHLLEANLITPLILGRHCMLSSVVIFVALIFFTWLWGVAGALLSMPLLVTAKVVCERVPALSSWKEFLAR